MPTSEIVRVRCPPLILLRLDELAAQHRGNRSEAIRAAVLEASVAARGESPVMDYDELLRTLGALARMGSIPAIRQLLSEERRRNGQANPRGGVK